MSGGAGAQRCRSPQDQSSDAFLLGLADQRGGRLATFDRRLARLTDRPGLVEVLTP